MPVDARRLPQASYWRVAVMLSLAAVWTSVFFMPEFRKVLVPSRRSETPGVKRAEPSPRTGAVTPGPDQFS